MTFLRKLAFFSALALAAQPGPQVFRITPVRPVAELRTEALAAQPPREQGELPPDGVRGPGKAGPPDQARYPLCDHRQFPGHSGLQFGSRVPAAPRRRALLRAHRELLRRGYGLLIFDAYRPWFVTKIFWDATPSDKHEFVADPAKGRGTIVAAPWI